MLLLLSQEILILSMPRLVSVRISGVVARNKLWLRFGFRASKGGDVRKLTGGAGTGSSRFRTSSSELCGRDRFLVSNIVELALLGDSSKTSSSGSTDDDSDATDVGVGTTKILAAAATDADPFITSNSSSELC